MADANKSSRSENVEIPVNPKSGRPAGYGFAKVPSSQAADAISSLHHQFLENRRINVQMARPADAVGSTYKKTTPTTNESEGSSDDEMETGSDSTSYSESGDDHQLNIQVRDEGNVDQDSHERPAIGGNDTSGVEGVSSEQASLSAASMSDLEYEPIGQYDGGNESRMASLAIESDDFDEDLQDSAIADDQVPELQMNSRTPIADAEKVSGGVLLPGRF